MTARQMVVAVCCGRLPDLARRWEDNIAQLDGDEFFVLLDGPRSAEADALAECIRARGGRVSIHGAVRGLAAARNSVLDAWPDAPVLFVDDDVLLDWSALAAVRTAFAEGAHVVGVRLIPPPSARWRSWFFGPGQMHLVAWHPPMFAVRTWGACMGIDAAFAHRNGLRFDPLLGRTGHRLESGDDTSFTAAMRASGAREAVLEHVGVVHDVDATRFRLRYLLRRAYWQGRSEVRRGQAAAGLRKEWRRYTAPGARRALAMLYTTAFAAGVLREVFNG